MTNQNKDYSWRNMDWLDEIFEPYVQSLKPFKDKSPTAYSQVKAAIQAGIDEHYIGKGEAAKDGFIPFDRLQAAIDMFDKVEVNYDDGHPDNHKIEGRGVNVLRVTDIVPGHQAGGKNILTIHTSHWGFVNKPTPLGVAERYYTESEVEQRCIEARIDELNMLANAQEHVEDFDLTFSAQVYRESRAAQLSTNNKDNIEKEVK